MAQMPSPTFAQGEETPKPRFVEQQSQDPVVRFLAEQAVRVLDNPELSAKGRVQIVRDLQERIAHRLAQKAMSKPRDKKKSKPQGLGCPQQMARLRQSFKQASAKEVKPSPVKKVTLRPSAAPVRRDAT